MSIRRSNLYLMILFIEGIIVIFLSKYILPEKYFYDSNTIANFLNFNGPLLSFDSYVNTARFYKLFGFGSYPSSFAAGIFNYMVFFFFVVQIIRIGKYRISDIPFIFMLVWNIPVAVYLGQFSKEIISIIVIGIQILLVHYKIRYYKTLLVLITLIYSIFFRVYWVIVLYLSVLFFLVFNKGIDISKKSFLKIGKVTSSCLLYIGIFVLFLAVTLIMNRFITDARTMVNIDRINSPDALTIVQNAFMNTNFMTDMLNWIIGWIILLFPFNLFLVSGISSLFFIIWNIINVLIFIIILNKIRRQKIRNIQMSWAIAWVISFSMVQGMFEPDYGSFFKHEIVILPYFLYIYLIYKRNRNSEKRDFSIQNREMRNSKNLKKIMIITEAMAGGVRRHILDIVHHLNLEKYKIFIIYGTERCDSVFKNEIHSLEQKGIQIIGLSTFTREISPLKDLKSLLFLIGVIKRINPDILHCHSSKAGALVRIAGFLTGKKGIVYTPHGYAIQAPYLNKFKALLYQLIERLLAKIPGLTINVSYGEKKIALEKGILKDNQSIVIYNGIENNHECCKKKTDGLFVIGTVARFDASKDPLVFLEIAKKIVKDNSNVIFKYYGDGELKSHIECQIKKNNLEDKIILPGFVDNPIRVLCDFDIFLSTSLHEGMPYSLIEALSVGLPIVATNVTGNNEIVKDNYNGYLFPAGNVDMAVEKIKELMINQEKRIQFGYKSRELYLEKFRVETMINELENVYNSF